MKKLNPDSGADIARFVAYTNSVQIKNMWLVAVLEAAGHMAVSDDARVSAAGVDLLPLAYDLAREIDDALDSINTSKVLA